MEIANKLIRKLYMVLEADDYDWVVQDLFAKKGVSFLFGEAGCGKTWLILDLLIKLAQGEEVFGLIETNPSKTLLIEGDTSDTLLKERFIKMGSPTDEEFSENCDYVNKYAAEKEGYSLDLYSHEGRKNIEDCVKNSQCDLVIIDTLISFITDEKDPVEMQKTVQFLRKMAYEYNCHILICHHCRKKDTKSQSSKLEQSDMIGTSVLNRLASLIIGVERIESPMGSTEGLIGIKKTWFKEINPIHFILKDKFDNSGVSIEITYEAQENISSNLDRAVSRIKDYLKNNDITEFRRRDIAEIFPDLSPSLVKKSLVKLQEDGYIEASGNTNNRVFWVTYIEEF